MEVEGNYESDISESWSLIDINLNVETLAESTTDVKEPSSSKEATDVGEDISSKVSVDGKEFDDSDSIEVLEEDDCRDSEIDRLDMSVIDDTEEESEISDVEEFYYSGNQNDGSYLTVISNKKKFNNNNIHSVRNFGDYTNSELETYNVEYYMNYRQCNGGEARDEMSVLTYHTQGHPVVYRHSRNNFANTMLSLSVGVIFAAVACIAIGHFLGIQEAEESTGEIMQTLKKLQIENVQLQSRITSLNKGYEAPESPSVVEEGLFGFSPESKECRWKSHKSSKRWGKPGSFKARDTGKSVRNMRIMGSLIEYIGDQLRYLSTDGSKLKDQDDSSKRISEVLEKILRKLSLSHDRIENLYQKLVNLKNMLREKVEEVEERRIAREGRTAWKKLQDEPTKLFLVFDHPEELNTSLSLDKPKANTSESINVGDYKNEGLFHGNKTKSAESFKFDEGKRSRSRRDKRIKKEKKENEKKRKNKKKNEIRGEKRDRKKETADRRLFRRGREKTDDARKKKMEIMGVKNKRKLGGKKSKEKKKSGRVFVCKVLEHLEDYLTPDGKNLRRDVYWPNGTGFWFLKWAKAREEFRKSHKQGDWQFLRAKGRKHLRLDEDIPLNWQLKRALARESERKKEGYRQNLRGKSSRNDFSSPTTVFHEYTKKFLNYFFV